MDDHKLSDKIVLVTGSSRGIGRAISLTFAEEGATVIAVGRNVSALQKVEQESQGMPGSIRGMTCDVAISQEVEQIIRKIEREYGRLDILVNNAGVGHFAPLEELTVEQWDEMMNVNLKGVFLCCKYAIPVLKKQKSGQIINISSVAGTVTFKNGGGYCASKHGLMALNEVLIQELKPYKIKVSVICPGSVQTHFAGTPPKDYSLHPEDVARVALHIASSPEGVILNQVIMRPQVSVSSEK